MIFKFLIIVLFLAFQSFSELSYEYEIRLDYGWFIYGLLNAVIIWKMSVLYKLDCNHGREKYASNRIECNLIFIYLITRRLNQIIDGFIEIIYLSIIIHVLLN